MKKFSTLLLVFFLILGLVACGGDKEPTTGGTGEAVEASDVSVALLVGNLGDMSFNDSANEGLEQAAKDLGIEPKVIEFGNDPNAYEPNVIDAAEQGYDIIMGSATLQTAIESVADDYPESTFILFDSEADWEAGDFKNVYCITYKANEASFLGGYVAAAISETGTLGFLGGVDQPIINDFLLGYIEGAQQFNPDVKVITTYAGSYTDPSKGKELTIGMINQGADISFNVAGGTGVGLIEAASETGTKVLGVDSDQALMYKEQGQDKLAEVIPTSVLKNVGYSLYRAIDLYVKGELQLGTTDNLGIEEGGVGLADNEYYQEMVPEEVRTAVKDLEQKVIDGEVTISSAIGMTTDEISTIRDAVKP